jgi:hypothetical protein
VPLTTVIPPSPNKCPFRCNQPNTKNQQFPNSSRPSSPPLRHQSNHVQPIITSTVADTRCTDHFLPSNCPVKNMQPTTNGIVVGLPNTSTMQATHTCTLKLPNLPGAAQSAHIFPKMQSALLSIPKLCDAGCTAHFSNTTVVVRTWDGTVVLRGQRDPITKLWEVPLAPHTNGPTKPPQHVVTVANSTYKQKTLQELLSFLHATAGSPTVATWCPAINRGYYNTRPGLTSQLVRKYLPKAPVTVMGHLHMQRQGVRSTNKPPLPSNDYDDILPPPRSHIGPPHQPPPRLKMHDINILHWPLPVYVKPWNDLPIHPI